MKNFTLITTALALFVLPVLGCDPVQIERVPGMFPGNTYDAINIDRPERLPGFVPFKPEVLDPSVHIPPGCVSPPDNPLVASCNFATPKVKHGPCDNPNTIHVESCYMDLPIAAGF